MTKIYFSSYSKKLSNSDFTNYLRLIPPALVQKITSFKKWEDQHASLYGKLLLIKALEEAGFDADLLYLKYTKYGRPYLNSTPDFNISHSGYFAVCAISFHSKIGIDIEEMKPAAIADFKEEFSKAEWNKITQSGNSDYWFYYYWTAKEAAIKADGRGLGLPLSEINIKDKQINIDGTCWYIKYIAIDGNYMLHIATDKATDTEIDIVKVVF